MTATRSATSTAHAPAALSGVILDVRPSRCGRSRCRDSGARGAGDTRPPRRPGHGNRWITVADTYIDTIVRLTAPANARFMYLDNRCAFIAQALEAFHNKTWSKKELPTSAHRARVSRILEALEKSPVQLRSEELDYACKVLQSRNAKSWAEMVADVLDFASDLGLLIRRTLPGFPTLAEGIRHSVSHGPRSGQAKEVGITEEERYRDASGNCLSDTSPPSSSNGRSASPS